MSHTADALIKLQHISKSYQHGAQCQRVLSNLSLNLQQGERVSIMGQSGSGKSTLMNIMGLLDKPSTGEYWLNGQNVTTLSTNALAGLRNRSIGFVFQSFFLLPRLTALQNVTLPLMYCHTEKQEAAERATIMLKKVGLIDKLKYYPKELSGGQQQRVAIARALVCQPELILADEPTGALDQHIGRSILDLFIQLNQAENKTLVIITHDPHVAACCDIRYQMQAGQLSLVG